MYFFGTSNGFPAIAIQVFPLRGLPILDDFTTTCNNDDDENAMVFDAIFMILMFLL